MKTYNRKAIHDLLLAAFTAEELEQFCRIHDGFAPLLTEFSPKDNLRHMAGKVIDFCQRRGLWDSLLLRVKEHNPYQYGEFEPYTSYDMEERRWQAALARYRQKVARNYSTTQLFGQPRPIPLDQIYTDIYILEKPQAFRRFDITQLDKDPDLLQDGQRVQGQSLLDKPEGHRLFILGKPGAGKTTFLRHLALEAARGSVDRLPIFVTLKAWADTSSFEEGLLPFIARQFAGCGLPEDTDFVEFLLYGDQQPLILFDGLDEIQQESGVRANVIDALREFSRHYSNTQCLITCRTAATDYTFEGFTYVEVADFAAGQMETFVHSWFRGELAKAENFLKEIGQERHRGLRELARVPLLLAMLCLAFNDTLHFPLRRVEIYEDALDALLRKWDSSRNIRRDEIYRALSPGRKHQLLSGIAAQTFERGDYFLPQKTLVGQIAGYLALLPKGDTASGAEVDGEAVLKAIEAQHGILVERAHRIYSFAHLSFQEYYAAKYVVDNVASGTLARLLSHCTDDRWREVILLTASLMARADPFFVEFRRAVDRLIAEDERLLAMLRWAAKKSAETQSQYHPATQRIGCCLLLLYRDLALNLALAYDLDLDLAHALERACVLVRASDLVRALERARDIASNIARVLALASDSTHALDRASDITLALELASTHASVLNRDRDLARSRALASDINTLLDHALERARALEGAGDIDNVFDQASALGSDIARASARAGDIDRALVSVGRKLQDTALTLSQAVGAQALYHALSTLNSPGKNSTVFLGSFSAIMSEYCNFGYDGTLSWEQVDRLGKYFVANPFLLECLDVAYVSDRQAIEDSLLLPPGMWQPADFTP